MICYDCKVYLEDTRKPETICFMKDGEIKYFQRYDVLECPLCNQKVYGTPGGIETLKEFQELNPDLEPVYDALVILDYYDR